MLHREHKNFRKSQVRPQKALGKILRPKRESLRLLKITNVSVHTK